MSLSHEQFSDNSHFANCFCKALIVAEVFLQLWVLWHRSLLSWLFGLLLLLPLSYRLLLPFKPLWLPSHLCCEDS